MKEAGRRPSSVFLSLFLNVKRTKMLPKLAGTLATGLLPGVGMPETPASFPGKHTRYKRACRGYGVTRSRRGVWNAVKTSQEPQGEPRTCAEEAGGREPP